MDPVFLFFFSSSVLQSNKKEKEPVLAETKKDLKPVTSELLQKPKPSSLPSQLQPQPPSSPMHGESRRGGGRAERGVKRGFKKKSGDKATMDSVEVKMGSGDVSDTSSKPVAVAKGELQPQEPSAKRAVVRLPKTGKEASSEKSAAVNGKDPSAPLPARRSPQTQRRDANRSRGPELGPGEEAASSDQVRPADLHSCLVSMENTKKKNTLKV